jgi:hypothetical protein
MAEEDLDQILGKEDSHPSKPQKQVKKQQN